ncbi:MAG TPA: YggS family pyridoxal phosphate-dependent enzyme [Methylophilaceae bacterium]|nr:YggS family pyridoxal phosphate-dependent enzyme [Methylophilaceae bacterium]
MTTISERLQAVKASISAATAESGRPPDQVQLLAVSKAHPAEKIREAYTAGQRWFGENYLQEALDKQAQLNDVDIHWHFIGPIQSNKTQAIAQNFAWVHSVDRLKIAERLNSARSEDLDPLQICIQINVSGEASKSGVAPDQVSELADAVMQLPRLRLRGLMSIPAPTTNVDLQRKQFRLVREALEQLKHQFPAANLDTLSMGMSEDYVAAIAEGATIVRMGSAVFGPRPVKLKEQIE